MRLDKRIRVRLRRTIEYYSFSVSVFYAFLLKEPIFNRLAFYTSYWYKSVGYFCLSKKSHVYDDFIKLKKPFHWNKFSYYYPSLIPANIFNLCFIFLFLLYAFMKQDFIILMFLLSPLFAIYFLAEIKPEKVFFGIFWLALIYRDFQISSFIFPFSLLSLNSFVGIFPFSVNFLDNIVSFTFFATVLFLFFIILLYGLDKNQIKWTYNMLGNSGNPSKFLSFSSRRPVLIKLLILLFYAFLLFQNVTIYVALTLIILLISTFLMRLGDLSTDFRMFLAVVLNCYLDFNNYFLFILPLFFPFHLFGHIPKRDFDLTHKQNILALIQSFFNQMKTMRSQSLILIEYTGLYSMKNKTRFLWPLIEYSLKEKASVFPGQYQLDAVKEEHKKLYKATAGSDYSGDTVNFIKKFHYVLVYSEEFKKRLKLMGYVEQGVIYNPELSSFNLKSITILKRADV